jgi:hypothetical protein
LVRVLDAVVLAEQLAAELFCRITPDRMDVIGNRYCPVSCVTRSSRTERVVTEADFLFTAERRHHAKTLPGRACNMLRDIIVGYGCRPARAAFWLA